MIFNDSHSSKLFLNMTKHKNISIKMYSSESKNRQFESNQHGGTVSYADGNGFLVLSETIANRKITGCNKNIKKATDVLYNCKMTIF